MIAKKKIFPDWLLGVSFAATWTWAAAMLVGISIAQQQGIFPFIMWFLANTAAIPFFGWISRKYPILWAQTRRLPMRILMTIMLIFTLWFNMTGIQNSGSAIKFLTPTWLIVIPIVTLIAVWIATFKNGIKWSVVSDRVQWSLELGSMVLIALVCIIEHGGFHSSLSVGWGFNSYNGLRGWILGMWTVPLLLANPFLDGTFWHRAAYAKSMKPYWWGYGMFMVYLLMVAIVAFLGLTPIASIILFLVIFFASFSTLDSCTAGLQLTAGWKVGNILGIVAAAGWLLVAPLKLLDVWSLLFVWYPFLFAIQIVTAILEKKKILKPVSAKTLNARDALPIIDGEEFDFSELEKKAI